MAEIKRKFAAEATIVNGVSLTGTTEIFSSNVDLETNGYDGTHIFINIDFVATPTDNVIVAVYGSLDGVNYDNLPISELEIDKAVDPSNFSLIIRDVANFRVGLKQSGNTDTHVATVKIQSWNYETV